MKKNKSIGSGHSAIYPSHIAIIMDGNGRWAKKRGLGVVWGHNEGASRIRDIVRFCSLNEKIHYLSLFAFSTENWNRPKKEISDLMDILVLFLKSELDELKKNKVKLVTSGKRDKFTKRIITALDKVIFETKNNTNLVFNLCLDYGGRQEIVDAVNKFNELGTAGKKKIDLKSFRKYLYLPQVPDIDLLIRTSGEERISNFMLWQIAYSEIYFTDTLWPDFTTDDLEKSIVSYSRRARRFGKRI